MILQRLRWLIVVQGAIHIVLMQHRSVCACYIAHAWLFRFWFGVVVWNFTQLWTTLEREVCIFVAWVCCFHIRDVKIFHRCERCWNEKSAFFGIDFDNFTPMVWIFSQVLIALEWEVRIFVDWVSDFHTGGMNFFTGVDGFGMRSLHFYGFGLMLPHQGCEFVSYVGTPLE